MGGSKKVLVMGGKFEGLDAGTVAAGHVLKETEEGMKIIEFDSLEGYELCDRV